MPKAFLNYPLVVYHLFFLSGTTRACFIYQRCNPRSHLLSQYLSSATPKRNPLFGTSRSEYHSTSLFAMAKKFYAVAVGRKPGIYESWDDCKVQVNGCKQAKYKGFPTHAKAKEFIALHTPKVEENIPIVEEKKAAVGKKQKKVDSFFITANEEPNTKKSKKTIIESNIHIIIFFDGGSRGNGVTKHPVAGSGAVLKITDKDKKEEETIKLREFLIDGHVPGKTMTNNYAEYTALIIGLKEIRDKKLNLEGAKLNVYGDSMLAINQLSGSYQCRSENIYHLYMEAKKIIQEFKNAGMIVELTHVFRNQNAVADELANEAMEEKRSWTTSNVKRLGKALNAAEGMGDRKNCTSSTIKRREDDLEAADD